MAISKSVVFHGVTIPSVYHRITAVMQNRNTESNLIEITKYTNLEDGVILTVQTYSVPYENIIGDVLAWAYNQLKTLPEFADAIDV